MDVKGAGFFLVAALAIGCAEGGPASTWMPPADAGAEVTTRPAPDPNVPLVCQEESWPDCPEGVFAFTNYHGEGGNTVSRFVDMTTCSAPVTCAECQYAEPGSDCNSKRRTYHGYCARVKSVSGTCDKPGPELTVLYPVFCIDINDGVEPTCPGG